MWVGIISQLFDISLEYEELWIIKGFKGQNQHAGTWRVCSFRYKPNQWQIQIQQRHLDWVKNYIRKKLQHLWVLVYELSNAAVVPRGHQITNHNTSPPPHPPPPPRLSLIIFLFPHWMSTYLQSSILFSASTKLIPCLTFIAVRFYLSRYVHMDTGNMPSHYFSLWIHREVE